MKVTIGNHSFGPLGVIMAGILLIIAAVNILLPMNFSPGIGFVYLLLTGLFLVLGV